MNIATVLTSDTGLTLLGTVLGGAWTWFKSSEWLARRRNEGLERALLTLESAVEQTYRCYVRAIKEGRADGKLTSAERVKARTMARERALAIARTEGIDLLRLLGEEHLDLWISKVVRGLKRG